MSEKSFETRIKGFLKIHNCYNVKFFANGYTRRGVPDILACVNGWFVGIEVKDTTGKPSPLQLENVKQIRKSGGYAWVVYPSGWEDLQQIILNLINNVVIDQGDIILK